MSERTSIPTARPRPTVLLVDDELESLALMAEALEADGFSVAQTPNGKDAVERLRGFAYDAMIVDLRLPDSNGMDVLNEALSLYPEIRAVVITGFGGVADAVDAIKRGAVDFLIKPFPLAQMARVLHAAFEQQRLRQENEALRSQIHERFSFDNIIGNSAPLQKIFATIRLVAPMNSTVLIQGETGTGKELIARTIHAHSPRRDQQFVAFNAAAIPESLAEAELFGHVKGAFTGAVNARVGRFELAHRGTLFIDEVAEMSAPLQAKLLRALQERTMERVGDSRSVTFDIRVIAASNVDLKALVKEGKFREDLFYRLNVVPITLPPLRTRRDDIPMLAQHFVRQSYKTNGLSRADHRAGRDAGAHELLVARQHPPVRKRHRACRGDERDRVGDHGRHAADGAARARTAGHALRDHDPGRRHQLRVGRVAAGAGSDPAVPRKDRRKQAAGRAASSAQPNHAHRQAAAPGRNDRGRLTTSVFRSLRDYGESRRSVAKPGRRIGIGA